MKKIQIKLAKRITPEMKELSDYPEQSEFYRIVGGGIMCRYDQSTTIFGDANLDIMADLTNEQWLRLQSWKTVTVIAY